VLAKKNHSLRHSFLSLGKKENSCRACCCTSADYTCLQRQLVEHADRCQLQQILNQRARTAKKEKERARKRSENGSSQEGIKMMEHTSNTTHGP
jgi:hypothetical protein